MIEYKFSSDVLETGAQVTRNGVPVGIVRGYLASWKPDIQPGRYGKPDRFMPGAFKESILEHKQRGDRQIRLCDNHGESVGGFPIDKVKEDAIGLWVEGEVNLETKRGRELYSMVKQGVLTDFSIGFRTVRDRVNAATRDIYKAIIGEGSIVDEPKNRHAPITEVKGLVHDFIELDIAPADFEFKSAEARKRIDEMPFRIGNGAHAFLCGDERFLIGDVLDGKLVAVPQAVRDASLELKELDESEETKALIVQAERYLAKMNIDSPFETAHFYGLDEVKSWEDGDLEQRLRATGLFSKAAVRYLVRSREPLKPAKEEVDETKALMDALEKGFSEIREVL